MILCSEIELSLQKTKYYDKIPSFSEDQTKMKIGMYLAFQVLHPLKFLVKNLLQIEDRKYVSRFSLL